MPHPPTYAIFRTQDVADRSALVTRLCEYGFDPWAVSVHADATKTHLLVLDNLYARELPAGRITVDGRTFQAQSFFVPVMSRL